MPRTKVYTAVEINKIRGIVWERNYEYRGMCKAMGQDMAQRVLSAIARFPDPVIDCTGELDRSLSGNLYAWNEQVRGACSTARLSLEFSHLLVYWYWSESGWMDYVRSFQAMPEPYGKYIMSWERRWMPAIVPKGCGKVREQVGNKSGVVPAEMLRE